MKKILLATTVLVGTAGFAAAEVSLSGNARMGVTYDESATNELAFNSRARVVFTLSGETDGGLSFGASFRADNASNNTTSIVEPSAACLDAAEDLLDELNCFVGNSQGGAVQGLAGTVFISGAFGKLSMGDTSSAAENAVGDFAEIGYAGTGFGNENTFIATGDNEMALYEYSAGGVTFMASVGQPSDGVSTMSIAAKYSTDAFSVAVGYEDNDAGADHTIIGATAALGGVNLKAVYGKADLGGVDFEQYGLGAAYTMDAVTVEAYYRTTDLAGTEADYYGIGVEYDLGGGATLAGGIADADGNTLADLGVKFTF